MAKVKIKAVLEEGSQYQVIIKIGGQVLHFEESGTQTIDLEPKVYVAKIAGFQDPINTDSSVFVEFKQGTEVLNDITITERKFIKLLFVEVN